MNLFVLWDNLSRSANNQINPTCAQCFSINKEISMGKVLYTKSIHSTHMKITVKVLMITVKVLMIQDNVFRGTMKTINR